jgi:hypothetical protein
MFYLLTAKKCGLNHKKPGLNQKKTIGLLRKPKKHVVIGFVQPCSKQKLSALSNGELFLSL